MRVCDWTVAGAAGCATPISPGWVTPPSPPAQPQAVGSTAVTSTWSLPGPAAAYVGTGANTGQIRVLVQTRRGHGAGSGGVLDLGQPYEDRLRRAVIRRENRGRLAMHAIAVRTARGLLALAVVAAGLALGGSAASAAPVSINLCAVPGSATLTGTVTVPIWGFGIPAVPGDCSTASAGLPGPLLDITLSATETTPVTITMTNALPAGHTVSFEIPGVTFDAGPTDAAPGGTVVRTFTAPISPASAGAANGPGTYLYTSGGGGNRQAAMGLYGALVLRPSTAGRAYEAAGTAYDVEAPLVLSAVDPAFNGVGQPAGYNPMSFNMYAYRPTYWLINGKAYPDTAPGITAAAGQRVLLRYVNAGFDNVAMALLGARERVVARDALTLNHPFDAVVETIPAGGTEDAIVTVPAGPAPSANGFPLYNRQLHLTNGAQSGTGPTPRTGGGMLTFIHPS